MFFAFFKIELLMAALMTIVCGGGISSLLTDGCVARIWIQELPDEIELRSLFEQYA